MLEIINSVLRNKQYYICMYPNYIYIYNYLEILNFKSEQILVNLGDLKIKIKGKKLKIAKMENKELLISGLIEEVNYE